MVIMARAKPPQESRTKSTRAQASRIPDNVYAELATDASTPNVTAQVERPLKRRRIHKEVGATAAQDADLHHPGEPLEAQALSLNDLSRLEKQDDEAILSRLDGKFSSAGETDDEADPGPSQVVYDETGSSEGSDVDWGEYLSLEEGGAPISTAKDSQGETQIHLELSKQPETSPRRRNVQRLPTTTLEKHKRLDVHKVHLCVLLAHVYIRNEWCNDHRLQHLLSPYVDKRVKEFLHPKPSLSQRDQTTKFIKGLEEVSHAWRGKFVISNRGLRKPQWPTDQRGLDFITKQAEGTEFDRGDFVRAAARPSGSRDVGAQLFCSLLRSVGVDARLVVSLQPLSFTAVAPAISSTAQQKPTVNLTALGYDYDTDASAASARSTSPTPRPIRRFGRGAQGTSPTRDMGKAPENRQPRRIRDSKYPVFWVEAFNTAKQQWVAVDPFATRSVNRPARIEPPASDQLNDLSYVIAFNENGTAKDVTRRYAKAYNAKTRRNRVESTAGGERWLRYVMRTFRFRNGRSDRDRIEDGELDGYEAKEPMPKNVQDFKGHPYYALERHLRRHEVIQPRREVGKLRVGKANNAVESVFRTRDVKACQTADKWYRSGRELRSGEQPVKRVKARRRPQRDLEEEDDEVDADGTVGLYTHDQTELYKPPSCEYGKVPKNPYKNLDLYVSSMIPPGGVHIRSSDAVTAARILRIDYAEAVTGFQFRGRKGTAITKGAVVASEYRDAMEETVEALRWQRAQSDRMKQTRLALGMWKRFLVGLRVRERVMGVQDESGSQKKSPDAAFESEDSGSEYQDDEQVLDTEGGFLAAEDDGAAARPTRGPDRDVAREKFQDDFAETINDDVSKKSKEYWEPTVVSPWDIPGLLVPLQQAEVVEDAARDDDLDALFEEELQEEDDVQAEGKDGVDSVDVGGGGFIPDGNGDSQTLEVADLEEGGFVREDEVAVDGEQRDYETVAAGHLKSGVVVSEGPDEASGKPLHSDNNAATESDDRAEDGPEAESLLSEDPDDADAEPDWLADEVGL